MSAFSQSKSVRRTELESRSSSECPPGSPDLELQARYLEQFKQSLAREHHQKESDVLERISLSDKLPRATGSLPDQEEASYEFRLFARPSGSGLETSESNELPRVALRSPTPLNSEPGFVNPQRAEDYYFTGKPSAEQAEQFSRATVSGEQVLKNLGMRWRGFELPWRVTVVKASRLTRSTDPPVASHDESGKRKRNGKKRRVVLRKRIEARTAMQLAAQQSRAEKEAAERDKRTRKNREKKVKKRQKEKLKKSQAAQDDGRMADSD